MKQEKTQPNEQIKYEYSDGKDRIFISYQRQSFPFVLKLSAYLEDKGVKTWYAPRNIQLEGLWPEKLHEAIQNCKAVLLLYTEQADRSKHVIREVAIADEYDKPVLWLKLDSSEPNSKVLKYYLSLVQTIEYSGDDAILESLYHILNQTEISSEQFKKNLQISTDSKNNIALENWTKGVYAFQTADEAAECAARVYISICHSKPNTTALLPTGRSAKDLFQAILRVTANECDDNPFGQAYLMNDTETFGVRPTHATSRIKVINDNLINILTLMNRAPEKSHLTYFGLDDSDNEPEDVCADNLQKHPPAVYGISLSPYMEIMGYDLGLHNSSIVHDGPRVVQVLEETKNYIDERQKTSSIYTIGLKTALQTDLIMLLAFESNKSNAIERLFKEKEDPYVPVSLLRAHKNTYLIITREIAKKAGLEQIAITNLSPKEAAACIVKK